MVFPAAMRRAVRYCGVAAAVKLRQAPRGHVRAVLRRAGAALAATGLYMAGQAGPYMCDAVTPGLERGASMRAEVEHLCLSLQRDLIRALEAEETSGHTFLVDKWSRQNSEEGGGVTCVLEGGDVLARAAVNVTVMTAPLSDGLRAKMRSRGKLLPEGEGLQFFAAGISSVVHPRNPHVPTFHFNLRYFEIMDASGNNLGGWFGGGADLTPYFLDESDARHFHGALKDACDRHGLQRYPEYKKTCDEYFYNPTRKECRGVGGLFFDDLESEDPKTDFAFVKDVAAAIVPCFLPLVRRSKTAPYNAADLDWQALRRGRYVEFNLGYDRGTKFGLATPGARIESIMVSMPPNPTWRYMAEPEPDTREGRLMHVLRHPRDWL